MDNSSSMRGVRMDSLASMGGVRMEKFPKIGAFWPSPGVMKYMGVGPPGD